MTTTELARTFNARREGKNYRAKCPCHKSRSVSLGLYPKNHYTKITCYAGCETADVLACVGLRLKDVFYASRDFSSEALKAHLAKQRIEKAYQVEQRRQDMLMMLKAIAIPPHRRLVRTQSRFERDIELFCKRIENKC